MDGDKETKTSHLFLVRLWMGEGASEEGSWYGKVQHVATGKAASFSSRTSMMQLLASMFSSSDPASAGRSEHTVAPE